jgi:RNA polymerase sigma-70 factor (ECF subfamily)
VPVRHEVFEQLYEENAQPLLNFVLYRTGDRALAEDIVADTFLRALTSRRPVDSRRGSPRAWLFTVALNLVRDHKRRDAVQQRAAEHGATNAGDAGQAAFASVERGDEVSRALAVLGPEEREAVALRYGADLPVKEIARITGSRPATVEKRLYRALGKLRDELPATSPSALP